MRKFDEIEFVNQVLKSAQELGYAESDPSADVEGWDARSKLCILTKLAFGVTVGACNGGFMMLK